MKKEDWAAVWAVIDGADEAAEAETASGADAAEDLSAVDAEKADSSGSDDLPETETGDDEDSSGVDVEADDEMASVDTDDDSVDADASGAGDSEADGGEAKKPKPQLKPRSDKERKKVKTVRPATKKEMKELARAVTWSAIWPILMIGGILMMLWSVKEVGDAFSNRHFGLEIGADGEYIAPEPDDAIFYLEQIHLGWIRRGILFFVYTAIGMTKWGWSPRMLYYFVTSVLWFFAAGVSLFIGYIKMKRADFRLKEAWNQLTIDPEQYQSFVRRANRGATFRDKLDLPNFCFAALAILVSLFEWFFVPATFPMSPILVLEIIFLILEVIKQKALRLGDRNADGVTRGEELADKAGDLADEARDYIHWVKTGWIGKLFGGLWRLLKKLGRKLKAWFSEIPGWNSLKNMHRKWKRWRAKLKSGGEDDLDDYDEE